MGTPAIERGDITGIVLAGGLGRRMSVDGQGVDKGLQPFRGRPMVQHAIERLAPQVGTLLVNANRNQERYRALGWPVVSDAFEGFAGPLAGLHAGMRAARTRYVVTVPCDSPFLPSDLVARLSEALVAAPGARLAVARTGTQPHPVFALLERALLDDLEAFLAGGRRKIDAWHASLPAVEVDFTDEAAFRNINTPQELRTCEGTGASPGDSSRVPGETGVRMTAPQSLAEAIGCLSDYDPDALPVASVREIVERVLTPVEAIERVAIRAALGRVLADDLVSPIDVPSSDNSAMDGYAVRADDLAAHGPTALRVAGTALAGQPWTGSADRGEAVRVMTGALMPEGFDTVVVQEAVSVDGECVIVPAGQQRGQNRRRRGEDLACGKPALHAGKRLAPADLGLLASLGFVEVAVRRRLRVAFFSTGDELRSVGEPLGPGEVYDSNRYTIFGMLTRLGVEVIDMGVVRDDPDALEHAVRTASECADAIVSSGGVSVGEADFTRRVMARLGDIAFWSIAMRPGRPMAFGRIGKASYFGLPGNPVAVMVAFYFFAREALLRQMGVRAEPLPFVRARCASAFRKRPGRTEYQRARLVREADGTMTVHSVGNQGSGVLRSMSEANCIVVLHHDQGAVAPGDAVDCVAFEGLI
ncbi:MAG: molybdenum cofactor guanylyltransferase [Burkholderiaceae bacterium]|nr:molybdenum cofactor guanylyltransferase [Burkholderiaceae bacterium]